MRVLLAHNYYQTSGGEDQVFHTEAELLSSRGHEVVTYTEHNDRVISMSRISVAASAFWNIGSYRQVKNILHKHKYHIVHFHNLLPLLSPSALHATYSARVPVVMTLHNYRLLCVNALFYRNNNACELCLRYRLKWPGIKNACYRGSVAASAVTALSYYTHSLLGTWNDKVDIYIALTEFAREKHILAGFPEDRVIVKPNFVYPDFGAGSHKGRYALYVGRLSPEKGVDTLLSAWIQQNIQVPLVVIGDGPYRVKLERAAAKSEWINYLGRLPHEEVIKHMKQARFLIFPSEWYEGFPMTIAESYTAGLPVVASNMGAMSTLIHHGRTGLLFEPKDTTDLAAAVDAIMHLDDNKILSMQKEARGEYEEKYSAERNYEMLMGIYQKALDHRLSV